MRSKFFMALGLATLIPLIAIPFLNATGALRSVSIWPAVIVASIISNGHVATTLWFHGDPDYRPVMSAHRWRMIAALLIIPLALLAVSLLSPTAMSLTLAAYMVWQAHHYSRQNFGILSFAAAQDGFGKLPVSVSGFVNLTTIGGALGMATWARAFPLVPGARWLISPQVLTVAIWGSVFAFIAAAAVLGRLLIVEPRIRRSPTLLAFLGLTFVFYLPVLGANDMASAFWPYAFAHGAQYLVFMTVTAGRSRFGLVSAALLLCGATALSTASYFAPTALNTPIWTGLVVWHFLADAKLWKMGDPTIGESSDAGLISFFPVDRTPEPSPRQLSSGPLS